MGNADSSQNCSRDGESVASLFTTNNNDENNSVAAGSLGRGGGSNTNNSSPSPSSHHLAAADRTEDGDDPGGNFNRTKRQRTASPNNMTPGNDQSGNIEEERMESIENDDRAGSHRNDSVVRLLSEELAEVEDGLTQQRSALFENSQQRQQAGQAIFDSIGSALGSIRNRLQGISSSLNTRSPSSENADSRDAGTTTATRERREATNAVASAETEAESDSATSRRCRSSVSDLSQRLQTAERAYSLRMPLGLLRSQLSRREVHSDGDGPSSDNAALLEGEPPIPADMPLARGGRSVSADTVLKDDGSMRSDLSDDEPQMRSRHRSSTLHASRRRSDIYDQREVEIHESAVGGSRPATILETLESDLSMDAAQEKTTTIEKSDQRIDSNDDDDYDQEGDEVDLLLPESTREQLGAAENHMQLTSSLKVLSHSSSKNYFPSSSSSSSDHGATHVEMVASTSLAEGDAGSSASNLRVPSTPIYIWGSTEFDIVGDGSNIPNPSKSTYALFGKSLEEEIQAEEVQILSPKLVPSDTRLGNAEVISASISETHMAFCTSTLRILGCGDNTCGALDPSQRSFMSTIHRPTHLEVLAMQKVIVVACGKNHTAAITESRSVLTWGSNDKGQLGHRLPPSHTSKMDNQVKSPAMMHFKGRASDVKCGNGFTLVLTTRMQVFMCGREEISSLNASALRSNGQRLPQEHPALMGLPLVFIAAGDCHAVVVTAHGTCYAWGNNDMGQCGRQYPIRVKVPCPVIMPRTTLVASTGSTTITNWEFWETGRPISLAGDVNIAHAACGLNHTVLVTKTGRLLVCGSNESGQLGLPSPSTIPVTSVQEVVHPSPERKFVSAEAGTNHTLLLDDCGGVYHLGNSKNGGIQQISTADISSAQQIVVGGSTNLVLGKREQKNSIPIKIQTASGLDELLEAVRAEHDEIPKDSSSASSSRSLAEDLCDRVQELFKNASIMNSLFMDPMEIENLYQRLITGGHSHDVRQKIVSAIEAGMIQALESMKKDARLMYPESVRFLLLFLACPLFRESKTDSTKDNPDRLQFDEEGKMLLLLCETVLGLPFEGYKSFCGWAVNVYSKNLFVPFLVKPLVIQLNKRVEQARNTLLIPAIAGVLRWFETAAEHSDTGLARPEDFYCSGIEQLPMESLYEDLFRYTMSTKSDRATHFYLAANSFLYSPLLKRNLLQIENQLTMVHAAQSSGVNFDPRTREFQFQPYFVLSLDRQYLLPQTLQAVASATPRELRKSLKVVFKGEDGVDAGGVAREFFMLLVQQLFDPATGMWTTSFGNGNDSWFNSDCTWNDDGYYLTGILFGLALYNGVLLDVHFPQAVYRKLLGLPLGLEDLVDEEVRKGLQQLLDYDGDDVESIFCLNWQVTWVDLCGIQRTRELKRGGSNIPVTSENKEEYTLAYVKWILVDSIAQQYDEFERGFLAVTAPEKASPTRSRFCGTLDLLRPHELELLVVGSRELDFAALEKATKYEGGYDGDSAVVRNLWRFIKSADPEEQLRFLKFTTGSIKAPIGGLGNLSFLVQRAGPDSMQLPTSHTCFNTLLLPDYGDNYEKLVDRLGIAIRECSGFGLQ